MKKIGFVVAMEKEYEPFLQKLGKQIACETLVGVEFCSYENKNGIVILAKCGVGEIASASATALLIGHFGCSHIVNFGLVGALTDINAEKSIVAVESVVYYDMDLTAFGYALACPNDLKSPYVYTDAATLDFVKKAGLPIVRIASGDKFISNTEKKNWLANTFNAQICDMESAGIALTCARSNIPFTLIKVISDSADEGAAEIYFKNKLGGLDFCINSVLSAISVAK